MVYTASVDGSRTCPSSGPRINSVGLIILNWYSGDHINRFMNGQALCLPDEFIVLLGEP